MREVHAARLFAVLALVSLVAGAYMDYFPDESNEDGLVLGSELPIDGDGNATADGDRDNQDQGAAEFGAAPSHDEASSDSDSQSGLDLATGLMAGGAGGLGIMALGATFSEVMKVTVLIAFVAPMLARMKKTREDLLTRGRLLGYLEANAGIHFSALRDALGLANGVTAYHLHALENEGRIISWRDGKLRRYAIGHISKSDLDKVRNPIAGTRLAILEVLSESGALGSSGKEISEKLQISRQLLSYHLSELKQSELIGPASSAKRPNWTITEVGLEVLSSSLDVARLEAGG